MILGFKSIKSTETIYRVKLPITVRVADTMEERIKLMEVGFEHHVDEIEGYGRQT